MLQKKMEGCHDNHVRAVIISPTRELASQIFEVFVPFAEKSGLGLACYTGGRDMEGDIKEFNASGANIVVATPGQLQEMLHQKRCHLAHSVRSLEVLVLDEADRLLDMGFSESLNDILSYFPKQRRTVGALSCLSGQQHLL
jgi:ATP-dependent RNA helicase DDX55/SPB4